MGTFLSPWERVFLSHSFRGAITQGLPGAWARLDTSLRQGRLGLEAEGGESRKENQRLWGCSLAANCAIRPWPSSKKASRSFFLDFGDGSVFLAGRRSYVYESERVVTCKEDRKRKRNQEGQKESKVLKRGTKPAGTKWINSLKRVGRARWMLGNFLTSNFAVAAGERKNVIGHGRQPVLFKNGRCVT